ncbi:DUF2079 domain-containing protein [Streptomyces prunicolor]|uniref:DUF2079 domain-containing protein n=1 Tax=Streptomyces prunicolor TaxID=67348 RepID=UPI0037D72ACE
MAQDAVGSPGVPAVAAVGGSAQDPVLWILTTAVFVVYSVLSVSRYVTGNPSSWDLAIFTEAVSRYAHAQAPVVHMKGLNLLGDHFHPVMALFAPAFRVFPSPVTLLVGQALLTAASVVPVHRAASHLLTRAEARIVAGAYGFSWGLAGMNWSDVHEVAFAVPLIAASLSALVRDRPHAAMWWAAPLVFVKEDQGFTVTAIGLVLAVAYRERLRGLLLAAWGAGMSLLAVCVIIPAFNPQHTYPYWQYGGTPATLVSGLDTKLPTLALILLPTAFTAPRSPLAAVAVPALWLRFFASYDHYWGTYWHYSATAMPVVFIAAVDGLARIRAARREDSPGGLRSWLGARAPVMMAVTAVALAVWSPLSNLWQPQTYRVPAHTRAARAAERLIPAGATVHATLGELAPLVTRNEVYYFDTRTASDWILVDTAPGSGWAWKDPPDEPTLWFADVTYRTVYARDGVWLFRRVR